MVTRLVLIACVLVAGALANGMLPRAPLGFSEISTPPDNPLTPEKAALGGRLFSDPLLSLDRTVACANCHKGEHGFTLPERFGKGVGGVLTKRRPMTLLNRAWGDSQFWDGRAATLEDLALLPIQHPEEMAMTLDELERRLREHPEYAAKFRRIFGRPPQRDDVARALASFLRTLVSAPSAFLRFVAGDRNALSESAQRGFELFRGKARCGACHWDPNFTDEEFHMTGIAARQPVFDRGRGEGRFKTPTLHNVSRRPPYMHDGSLADLKAVIDYYDRGGEPHVRSEVRPIGLTAEEKADLLTFLESL